MLGRPGIVTAWLQVAVLLLRLLCLSERITSVGVVVTERGVLGLKRLILEKLVLRLSELIISCGLHLESIAESILLTGGLVAIRLGILVVEIACR